jgi:class 3 adenylate cyclase
MDFTVMGNAVNVAARLEKLAGPGMILIDEETHARIAGLSEMSDRLEVHLKGQKNAIGVYQVKPKTA